MELRWSVSEPKCKKKKLDGRNTRATLFSRYARPVLTRNSCSESAIRSFHLLSCFTQLSLIVSHSFISVICSSMVGVALPLIPFCLKGEETRRRQASRNVMMMYIHMQVSYVLDKSFGVKMVEKESKGKLQSKKRLILEVCGIKSHV